MFYHYIIDVPLSDVPMSHCAFANGVLTKDYTCLRTHCHSASDLRLCPCRSTGQPCSVVSTMQSHHPVHNYYVLKVALNPCENIELFLSTGDMCTPSGKEISTKVVVVSPCLSV